MFSAPLPADNQTSRQATTRQTNSKATRGTQQATRDTTRQTASRHAEHDITRKRHSPDPNKERHYPRQAPHTDKQAGEQTARPSVVMTKRQGTLTARQIGKQTGRLYVARHEARHAPREATDERHITGGGAKKRGRPSVMTNTPHPAS